MRTDTDKPSVEADSDGGLSVEAWDEIIREFDQITATLGLVDVRLSRLDRLMRPAKLRTGPTQHSIAGERPMGGIFGGRRVLIDRDGHLWELPLGHSMQIGEPDDTGRQIVSLAARFSGWADYELESIEETENDRVMITLGAQIAHGGAQV